MFSRKQKFPLGKVAVGFALGTLVGAILAVLYAPLSGKKLQKKIAGMTEDLIDKVEETVDDVQSKVRRITKV